MPDPVTEKPSEYVVVPREPTYDMVQAGAATPEMKNVDGMVTIAALHGAGLPNVDWDKSALACAYRAMVAVSPSPPAGMNAGDTAALRTIAERLDRIDPGMAATLRGIALALPPAADAAGKAREILEAAIEAPNALSRDFIRDALTALNGDRL